MAYTNLSDLFKGICDAIRDKKGTTGPIKHQEIPSQIASIQTGADVSGVNASASDVKSGRYFVDSNGTLIQGTLSSKAAQAYTPSTSDQYIYSGQWLSGTQTIKGDANLVASNIKAGVNIFGITGQYKGGGSIGGFGDPITSSTDDYTEINFQGINAIDSRYIMGFYIVATEQVDSSSRNYITSLFINRSTYIVQYMTADYAVEYYTGTDGSNINWSILGMSGNY